MDFEILIFCTSPQEREFEQMALEQKRLSAELDPLEDYERTFTNRWNRANKWSQASRNWDPVRRT